MPSVLNFPKLRGDRICLTDLDRGAVFDIHEYSCMPEFFRYLEMEPHCELSETEQYFDKLVRRSDDQNGHYWMIKVLETEKVIGTFGVLGIDLRTMSAEIGYGISPLYWGQGYFSEALCLVLRFMFDERDFHRVWANTAAQNIGSIRALERAGFEREGLMRDFYRHQADETYMDAVILARVGTEQA